MNITVRLRRMTRIWLEARRNAKVVRRWWRRFIAECEEAENPMRLY